MYNTVIKRDLIPKDNWTVGPWTDEPDRVYFNDSATGYRCAVVRHPGMGHLCGYVQLPVDAPDLDYAEWDYNIHGGITYCGEKVWDVLDDPEPEAIWIGFDCAHFNDIVPGMFWNARSGRALFENGEYRRVGYVITECELLAEQIAKIIEKRVDKG